MFSSAATSVASERVADARAREPERLRERADDDHAVVEQPDRTVVFAELDVRLVDDERTRRRQRVERPGRIVRPAAERQHRIVVPDGRAGETAGDSVERIRRLVRDRHHVAVAGERARDEQDQIVGARTEDDVLRLDARVRGDRRDQLRIAAVRILVDARERSRDGRRPRRRQRDRRHVAVEADDGRRIEPGPARQLLRRRRPRVRAELGGERPHRSTAAACAGIPSTAASARTTDATLASPAGVRRCTVTGLRNVSRPRPPLARPRPPVGRTWFPPVA